MDNFFKQLLFCNGQPYGYARWRVLRDPYEVSKKYYFATLKQI